MKFLGLQSVLGQYIKSPYRLTDSGVLKCCKKNFSAGRAMFQNIVLEIKKQIEQLNKLITTFNRLIPVIVMSDNMTDIQVRGIGKLGCYFS